MKRLAVDIVILPPDPIIELAINANRNLLAGNPEGIVLGQARNVPHISLLMGGIASDLIDDATEVLRAISKKNPTLHLFISGLDSRESGQHNVISFDIERSNELATLHETIVNEFSPLLTQDATEEDFNDPSPIAKSSINWVNRFIPDACLDKFWPHITLGFGDYKGGFRPLRFEASRLALCHLGNHCTCSRILEEFSLAQRS